MNFYQHQDRARRRTALLVGAFLLAIVGIALALNAAVYFAVSQSNEPPVSLAQWLEQPYWWWISAGVAAVILSGSLHTTFKLRDGGPALAAMLGARRVDPSTRDTNERRLLNVVEEMSIASGTPVPALYVLDDEAGINAFVAGTSPSTTIMVVTNGALEAFTREELQSVVAHEYSHIFNGDMRLNIRLMGVLAGILLIGQLGRVILRSSSRSRRSKGSGAVLFAGLTLLAVGYIGLGIGELLKAAISRQREFLADASAVQFTRYPTGMAMALWRIKKHQGGGLLANSHADDISHFCFAQGIKSSFAGFLATHPPLSERIEAVVPHFVPPRDAARVVEQSAAPAQPRAGAALSAAGVAAAVGAPEARHAEFAHAIHDGLPAPLLAAVHDRSQVVEIIAALVLAGTRAEGRETALQRFASSGVTPAQIEEWQTAMAALAPGSRLPLVNLALPALRMMSSQRRADVLAAVRAAVAADTRLTVFEFALVRLLDAQLGARPPRAVPVKHYSLDAVRDPITLLLSVLARAGSQKAAAAEEAFNRAAKPFGFKSVALAATPACTLVALEAALRELASLSPLLKRNVITACADCVIHDGKVTPSEAELIETVALALDCPLPPLLAD